MLSQIQPHSLGSVRNRHASFSRKVSTVKATSLFEKSLLFLIIVALPLEDHLHIVPGFSILFFIFGIVAIYVLLHRPWVLTSTIRHPVFKAAYVFLGLSLFIEYTHPYTDLGEIIRIGQMVIGAILVATLCRDHACLKAGCYGYIVAGIWLSILLYLSSYGVLAGAQATDFAEASKLRAETFGESPLQANLNRMAFFAAQGTVVALASALTVRSSLSRNLFMGIGLFCLVATFLPLSRGGVVIAIVSCASVMYAYGLRQGKALILAALMVGAMFMWVPDAVWTRMSFSTESHDGKLEGRAQVYLAAVEHFPEYAITGVGAGNFWSSWGRTSHFAMSYGVAGAHNCFLQVTLYWGIAALGALLVLLWRAYRCLPISCGRYQSSLCLLGVAISLLLLSTVMHNVYAKQFSLGLGLLVASRLWIWPNGVIPSE